MWKNSVICIGGSVHYMAPPQENVSVLFNVPLLWRVSADFVESK